MTKPQPRTTVLSCDCGYTVGPATPGVAAYNLRRHSCERWREIDAREERALARFADIDRTPKPCRCPRARHEHGTRTAYIFDQCRCLPCAFAQTEYERARKRTVLYGRQRLIDADHVRAHLDVLAAAGMGTRRIAELAGVGRNAVVHIRSGIGGRPPARRVDKDLAAAILAVTVDPAPRMLVDGTGTRRRLQALVAMGWTQNRLAAELGITQTTLSIILLRDKGVHASTAAVVRDVYDRLWQQEPPATHTAGWARKRAAANGWVSPLAWDDETIDDPSARPMLGAKVLGEVDESAVDRAAAGDKSVPLSNRERREVVRRLHSQGLNDSDIERRTGIDAKQVLRDRQRFGLPSNHESRRTA